MGRTSGTEESLDSEELSFAGVCMTGAEVTCEGTCVAPWRAFKSLIRSFNLIREITTEHLEENKEEVTEPNTTLSR